MDLVSTRLRQRMFVQTSRWFRGQPSLACLSPNLCWDSTYSRTSTSEDEYFLNTTTWLQTAPISMRATEPRRNACETSCLVGTWVSPTSPSRKTTPLRALLSLAQAYLPDGSRKAFMLMHTVTPSLYRFGKSQRGLDLRSHYSP